MNYAIKGTEVNITEEIRSYVEKRLQGLAKFGTGTGRCDVELEYQALRDGKRYRAEFMCHEPGSATARAEARGETLHEAIDIAVGELVGEMSRAKKKRLHVLRRAGVRVKEYLRGWRNKV